MSARVGGSGSRTGTAVGAGFGRRRGAKFRPGAAEHSEGAAHVGFVLPRRVELRRVGGRRTFCPFVAVRRLGKPERLRHWQSDLAVCLGLHSRNGACIGMAERAHRGHATPYEARHALKRGESQVAGFRYWMAAASRSSKARFRSIPQRYPDRPPSVRTTRWQGIATATGLAAQAPATARTADFMPILAATSA